jgi:Amt family ammonium transporter
MKLRPTLGYDDSLDTFGIHGVGGAWGALATGLFASKLVNEAGNDGLFAGNPSQLAIQLAGVVATVVYAALVSFVLLKALDATMGLRVKEEAEEEGLDLSEHGELAYDPL